MTHAHPADHPVHGHHGERDQHGEHGEHGEHGDLTAMAASATLHCLTGCALGEIAGLVLGSALGWGTATTILVSIALAFVLGLGLSSLPLLRAGLALGSALGVVVAADTLSITTMEVVDNLVMALIPGAMDAGLDDTLFWVGMPLSLVAAFAAALPVNRRLLARGRGHALTHRYHGAPAPMGARRLIPDVPTPVLVAALTGFILGGLLVSLVG